MRAISHSQIQTFKECNKKYYYSHIERVKPISRQSFQRFGEAFSLGVGPLAQKYDLQYVIDEVFACYPEDHNASGYTVEIERESVIRMLTAYDLYWSKQSAMQCLIADRNFDVKILNPITGYPSTAYHLVGRIDSICELADGRIALVKHRTTSQDISKPDADFWRLLRIDQQLSLLVYAAKQMGYNVDCVIYDAVRSPSIEPRQIPCIDEDGFKIVHDQEGMRVFNTRTKQPRQSADKAKGYTLQTRIESPEEYGIRLEQDILNRPDWYFSRQEIPRLESDIQEFEEELWDIQKSMRESEKNNRHYKNTSACFKHGRCAYFDLCYYKQDVTQTIPQGFEKIETNYKGDTA